MYKIFLIFFILLIGPLKAEQFTSIENFSFELPKGYMILSLSKNIKIKITEIGGVFIIHLRSPSGRGHIQY